MTQRYPRIYAALKNSVDEAIAAWNRRADLRQPTAELIKRAESLVNFEANYGNSESAQIVRDLIAVINGAVPAFEVNGNYFMTEVDAQQYIVDNFLFTAPIRPCLIFVQEGKENETT